MTPALLQAALAYAARGWRVHPCRPRGKEPLTEHGWHDATTDPAIICRWWERWPRSNVGLACAPSGLLVIDVDPRHGGDVTMRQLGDELDKLPATVTAETGGGGWHLIWVLPGGELRGSLGPGVDIRAPGYIVAPPSVHPTGRRYRWAADRGPDDLQVAKLPQEWLAMVARPAPPPVTRYTPRRTISDGTRYARVALAREVEAVAQASPGSRNNRLNAAAVSLGRLAMSGRLDGDRARDELLHAAMTAGLPEGEARRTIESGYRYGVSCGPRGPQGDDT